MSDVTPWMRSGLMVALNAMREPSGDQEKEPTLYSVPFVRRLPLRRAPSGPPPRRSSRGARRRSPCGRPRSPPGAPCDPSSTERRLPARQMRSSCRRATTRRRKPPSRISSAAPPRRPRCGSRRSGSCRPFGWKGTPATVRRATTSGMSRTSRRGSAGRVSPVDALASQICVTKASCLKSGAVTV